MKQLSELKVAIVHDWLVGGGAERVVNELHQMFPDAPIYTSYATNEWRRRLDDKVVTGYLQRWPFSALRKFLPILRIWWFTSLDFTGYDLVISSSGNGEAKGVRTPKETKHVCYCHTPTHFYWRHYAQYMKRPGFGLFDPLARLGLRLLVGPLRRWDLRAARRPDYILANSTHIQADIKRYYGRESSVIYPPIDVERFSAANSTKREGFVTAGRQATMKHTGIIVEACSQLGVPLTVIGRGPDHQNLVRLAGPTVTFLTNVTDAEMANQLASAEAFLFASFEDFGITPVEAMAAGTPVIAYAAGGALDYVLPGKTGEFFKEQTTASLVDCLKNFDSSNYAADDIKKAAHRFGKDVFVKSMSKEIVRILQ